MDDKIIRILEYVTLQCELDLKAFCEKFIKVLGLPQMSFDFENETEWGEVNYEHIHYNVSKPYAVGTLKEWDNTVPYDCNFGVSFGVMNGHTFAENETWIFENIVQKISERLADEFNTTVYYHRTHLVSECKNISRKIAFSPLD